MSKTCALSIAPLFGDGMVLQRDTSLKIWGKATPNEPLQVEFRGQIHLTQADPSGNWELTLAPMVAGGPFKMRIIGQEELTIQDICVGDIWLLGGQSNMELPVSRTLDLYEQEVSDVENPFIRQFTVPLVYDFQSPRHELAGGEWKSVTPQNVLGFSALGYFFGQDLYRKYNVPIGLILTAVGGTPIEAWMSEEVITELGGYEHILSQCKDRHYVEAIMRAENERMNNWYSKLDTEDAGCSDCYDHSSWNTFSVPNSWANTALESVHGSVWFRKSIDIPVEMLQHDALLRLGAIIDADETYVNGVLVGKTDYKYPPRKYKIPPGVLRPGTNTITVRVISNRGVGGFVTGKSYSLLVGPHTFDLSGPWKYKIGAILPALPQLTFFHYKPTGVYNGMIAPLSHYAFTGVLWYQGESNTHAPERYEELFRALIANWRQTWNRPDLPFLFVQLPNFQASLEQTPELNWALLREAQRLTLELPNTAMVVTIDVGEENDLHPQNKKDIGERLALCARQLVYGEQLVAQGPMFQRMEVRGRILHLFFSNLGGGLVAKGGLLNGFTVCGSDEQFIPAVAELAGDRVLVWSDQIAEPRGVRYAWADNPKNSNLYNREGLPASPFQAFVS